MGIFMKVDKVAKDLNVSPNAIYAEIRRGVLKPTRVGRLIRIKQEDLDTYLNRPQDNK